MSQPLPSLPRPPVQQLVDQMTAPALKAGAAAWMRLHGAKFLPKHMKAPREAKAPATPKVPTSPPVPGKSLSGRV